MALTFPSLDPVLFSVGPVSLRWYGLAYVAGILGGVFYVRWLAKNDPRLQRPFLEDLIPWLVVGIVAGGRLGYVLFYGGRAYWENPLEILYVWKGGMAFHGGLLGAVLAILLYSRTHKTDPFLLGDYGACAAPIGIFFGRLANFINAEVVGRITDVPWAMVFPRGGPWPRHPSQLYEAALEGIALWGILYFLQKRSGGVAASPRRFLTGAFFLGYGMARFGVEFWREPDVGVGYIGNFLTMGQLLSLPLILGGLLLIGWRKSKPSHE
jgi:phosphatidylglycerol:prolipoprotein diacylglycerol transferase